LQHGALDVGALTEPLDDYNSLIPKKINPMTPALTKLDSTFKGKLLKLNGTNSEINYKNGTISEINYKNGTNPTPSLRLHGTGTIFVIYLEIDTTVDRRSVISPTFNDDSDSDFQREWHVDE
jgi:hypothetical protein